MIRRPRGLSAAGASIRPRARRAASATPGARPISASACASRVLPGSMRCQVDAPDGWGSAITSNSTPASSPRRGSADHGGELVGVREQLRDRQLADRDHQARAQQLDLVRQVPAAARDLVRRGHAIAASAGRLARKTPAYRGHVHALAERLLAAGRAARTSRTSSCRPSTRTACRPGPRARRAPGRSASPATPPARRSPPARSSRGQASHSRSRATWRRSWTRTDTGALCPIGPIRVTPAPSGVTRGRGAPRQITFTLHGGAGTLDSAA